MVSLGMNRKEIHHRIYSYGLALVALTLPFPILVNSAAIGIVILNWLLEGDWVRRIRRMAGSWIFWLLVLYYFNRWAGVLYTEDLSQGLFNMEKTWSFLIFPVILFSTKDFSRKDLDRICIAFVAGTAVTMFYYLGNILINHELINMRHLDPMHPVLPFHKTYLALYLNFSIFLIVQYTYNQWYKLQNTRRWLLIGLALLMSVTVVLTSSRMGILSLVLMVGMMILFGAYRTTFRLRLLIAFTMLVGIGTVITVIPYTKKRFVNVIKRGMEFDRKNPDSQSGLTVRLVNWECAWNIIRDHPLVGVGTGEVRHHINFCYLKRNFFGHRVRYNAHNQFLQTAAELGIIGLITLFSPFAYGIRSSIRKRKWEYLIFLGLLLIPCLTDTVFGMQKGVVFYTLFNTAFMRSLKE